MTAKFKIASFPQECFLARQLVLQGAYRKSSGYSFVNETLNLKCDWIQLQKFQRVLGSSPPYVYQSISTKTKMEGTGHRHSISHT